MLIITNFLVMLVGLLLFLLCKTNADVKEVGRIMFAFGLLVMLLNGDKVVGLLVR